MYALLLVFGTIIATTGVALVGSAISVQDHTFDPSIITPGMIAVVGGFLLIGFGLAVRQLIRIEHALGLRPIVGTHDAAEPASLVAAPPEPAGVPEIPLAVSPVFEQPQPATQTEPAPAVIAAAGMTPAAQEAERLREKFPSLLRLETAPVVDETEASLSPKAAARIEEQAVANGHASNGAAKPQADVSASQAGSPGRTRNFDALWPKRRQSAQGVQVAGVQVAGAQVAVVQPALVEPVNGAAPHPEQVVVPRAPSPVSVLKSGVVDGMAYTLYSDGSIEAQLPQGTLRFGSIADLRHHIEQHAS